MRSVFILFFVLSFVFGMWITHRSWDSAIFVYLGENRGPASNRSAKDIVEVPAASLVTPAHFQLIEFSDVLEKDGAIGIQLGHPLLKSQHGFREFACGSKGHEPIFEKIEITFIGDGSAQSGEPPRLIVESLCVVSDQIEKLQPVWLPLDIFANAAKDKDLQLYGDQPVSIQLKQIPEEWPQSWFLSKVRFFSENSSTRSLEFEAHQLREARGALLSFKIPATGTNRFPTSDKNKN